MNRQEAIESIIIATRPETVIVATTGLISREIFEKFDSDRNFYVPGSMGLVSSIGLGIAIVRPDTPVTIIDGDASILMNLGSIVTIGNLRPANLLHIVIDNSAYGSCSEEKSMSETAHLDEVARNVGYAYSQIVGSQEELQRAILMFRDGPGFTLAKICLGGRRDFRRPLRLTEIKDRFMLFLSRSSKGVQL